jgi:hypothetical protein
MTLNPNTGTIDWTPSLFQIGSNPVTVRASNSAGSVDQSYTIQVVGPIPPTPTGLAVTNVDETTATLHWDPIVPVAGIPLYRIYHVYKCGFHNIQTCYSKVYEGSDPIFSPIGLSLGATYQYTVTAFVGGQESPKSTSVSFTTLNVLNPLNLRVEAATQTSLTLAWDPNPASVPVVSYSIFEEIIGIGGHTAELKLSGITGLSGALTGLTPNSHHYLFVRAYDIHGHASYGFYSVQGVTLSPPVIYHSNGYGTQEIVAAIIGENLFLAAPSLGVATPIVGYQVGSQNLPALTWSMVTGPEGMTIDSTTGLVTWNNVTGSPGVYTATLRGTNSEGSADFSFDYTIFAAGTDLLCPEATTVTSATTLTATGATISWNPAIDNVAVVGYKIYTQTPPPRVNRFSPAPGPLIEVGDVPATTTSFILNTLTPSKTYATYVKSYDAAGNLSRSGGYQKFTTLALPSLFHPSTYGTNEVVAAITGQSLIIAAPRNGLSTPIIGYQVQASLISSPVWSLENSPPGMSISSTGLVTWNDVTGNPGTYSATVHASNGQASASLVFSYTIYPADTDLLCPTPPVVNIPATPLALGGTITWNPSTDNIAVTGYKIYAQYPTPWSGNAPGPLVEIGSVAGSITNFTFSSPIPGPRSQAIYIKAIDAAGNLSNYHYYTSYNQ